MSIKMSITGTHKVPEEIIYLQPERSYNNFTLLSMNFPQKNKNCMRLKVILYIPTYVLLSNLW